MFNCIVTGESLKETVHIETVILEVEVEVLLEERIENTKGKKTRRKNLQVRRVTKSCRLLDECRSSKTKQNFK